jgi:hypothetical protein|tara:strand:+ start:308 stop:601 length:294 start_codon:yes stop_codon:yes gene_type:complete
MIHNLTAGAIHWKFPDHNITTRDNKIAVFEPGPVPTQTEIDGYIVEYEAHLKAIEYMEKRKFEYPPIEDQLDMIYHAGLGGDEFQEAIKIVKNKYPK